MSSRVKIGDIAGDTQGRVLRADRPIRQGYCGGCALAGKCQTECDGEDLIFIETDETSIAQYLARMMES